MAATPRTAIKDFDTSLKALLQTAFEVHDKAYGSMSSQQLWMVWANKFLAAYVKAKKPAGFHGMFTKFFLEHSDLVAVPIFHEVDEDVVVNDKWLRDTEFKKAPGAKAPSKSRAKRAAPEDSWSPAEMSRCAGYVVYFDTENPAYIAVSIPISEIYQCAIKLYKERGKKDPSCRTIPARLLHHLYAVLHNVLPDLAAGKEVVTRNCIMLDEFISKLVPTEGGTSESTGAGLQGIGKIMAQVMKAAGMPTSGIDESGINNMLGNALNENAITGMGKVVGEVIRSVQGATGGDGKEGKGPSDIGDVLGGIGKALQSDAVKSAVAETAAAAKDTASKLEATIPTTATVPTSDGVKPTLPLPSEGPSFDPAHQD